MNICKKHISNYQTAKCACGNCGNDKCKATQCKGCSGKVTVGHCASYRRPVKKKEGAA